MRSASQEPGFKKTMYTLRPNTDSGEWQALAGREDLPDAVAQLRATGKPTIVDAAAASEVTEWIEAAGWDPGRAPVLLDPVGN